MNIILDFKEIYVLLPIFQNKSKLIFWNLTQTFLTHSLLLVMDRLPETGFSGTRNQPKNGFKSSWNKAFIHFLSNFWHIFDDLMIF